MKNKLILVLGLVIMLGACRKEENNVVDEQDEINLDEIAIVLDKNDVIVGEQIRFDITGRADLLVFFSGEVGSDYYDNPFGGVETKGRVDYYTYLYPEPGEYDIFFLLKDNEGNERTIGPFTISVEKDPALNPELAKGTVNGTIGNPSYAYDLAGIASYVPGTGADPGNAHNVPEQIDMALLWLGGDIGFCLPTGVGSTAASGIFTLATKNDGVLFRLEDPTAGETARFEALERRDDLIAAFELEEANLTNREGYVPSNASNTSMSNHGPLSGGLWSGGTTSRIRGANVGDIFYFKSLNRDLYAAFRVLSRDYSNGGAIQFEVISILGN